MTTMLMIKDEAFHGDIEEQASDATILRARRLSHYLQHSSQRLADTFCWASVHLAQTFMTRVTVTSNELGKTQLATYVPPNAGAKNMPQIRNVNAILHRQDSRKLQETGHTYSGTKGKYVPPHLRMVDANTCLSSQVWQKVQKEGKSFQRTLSDVSMASTDTGTSVISDDATSCFSPSDGCPGMVRFSADIEVHYVEAYSRQAQWGCEKKGLVGGAMQLVDKNAFVCVLTAIVCAALQGVLVMTADCAVLVDSWPQKLASAQKISSVLGVASPAYLPQYQTIGSSMA